MADSLKFRDFRTNTEVEVQTEKQAKILEAGGYTRVTANTPALNKPKAEPNTVAEHVAAAQAAQADTPAPTAQAQDKAQGAQGKALPTVTEPDETIVALVETEEPQAPKGKGK